jgi:hypothetical protein
MTVMFDLPTKNSSVVATNLDRRCGNPAPSENGGGSNTVPKEH